MKKVCIVRTTCVVLENLLNALCKGESCDNQFIFFLFFSYESLFHNFGLGSHGNGGDNAERQIRQENGFMHTGHQVGSAGLQMGRRALPIRRPASAGRYCRGVQDKMVRQRQIFPLVRSRHQRHRLEVQSWCQALRAAVHKELTEKGVGVLRQPCPYVHHLQEQVETLRI